MSIDTLTADTNINRASPQVAKKNWETPIPNGIQENEMPDTGTVDMDFWDFVDIVNPLQHIPVVNTIYRELTGDTIKGVSRVIGGGLYGGVIGLVAGIGSAIVAETTGKDPGEHVLAMLTGSDDETPAPAGNNAIAEATPPTAAPAAEPAPAPASPPSASNQPTPVPTPAHRTAMAEPAAAGEILMPAARAAAPAQRRLGEPEARSFPVPKRTAGLLPRPVPVATGPAANIDKTPAQRAAAHWRRSGQARNSPHRRRSRRERRGPWDRPEPDGGMAAGRLRQGSSGTGGRYDDERVGQVQAGRPHRHRIHGERRRRRSWRLLIE